MSLYLLDSDEESVATPQKKPQPKKANKVVFSQDDDVIGASQESNSSVDIPLAQSCKLARTHCWVVWFLQCGLTKSVCQAAQETNSLLTSSLSKNRFSLDRIPVAKLKKSSKNPFASQDTNKTGAKRQGRPPKSKSQ